MRAIISQTRSSIAASGASPPASPIAASWGPTPASRSSTYGDARGRLERALDGVRELAAGGTAVGTGLNAPDGFGEDIAAKLAELTSLPLKTAPNKFAAQGSLDAIVAVSAGLRGVAVALMKIANDMRWLASGPRAGLHELKLPANEPGSSIMPGKVNPTQQEAMVTVCLQVIGEDSIVAAAGAQGNFELNAMRPIIINNVLHSARILGDASEKLRRYSIEGTELDQDKVTEYVGRSLISSPPSAHTSATTRPPRSRTKPTTKAAPSAKQRSRSESPQLTSTGSSTRKRWLAIPDATSHSNGPTKKRQDRHITAREEAPLRAADDSRGRGPQRRVGDRVPHQVTGRSPTFWSTATPYPDPTTSSEACAR